MNRLVILLTVFIYFPLMGALLPQTDSLKTETRQDSVTHRNDSLSFLPEGTTIHKRTVDKIYCFLPKNTMIQGMLCRGDRFGGWETVFYTNGNLAVVWLARSTEIQGVPCAAASFWTELLGSSAVVKFHPNGTLAQCKLARDVIIQGHPFHKGDIVQFDASGKLQVGK